MSRRSVGRYLAQFLCEVSDEYRATARPEQGHKYPGADEDHPAYIKAVNKENGSREEKHRTHEKVYWYTELVFTFLITVFTGFGAVFAFQAYRAAHTQAAEAVKQTKISKSGQLPYLFIRTVETNAQDWFFGLPADSTTHSSPDREIGVGLKWRVRFENRGTTPAVIDSIKASVVIGDDLPSLEEKIVAPGDPFSPETSYDSKTIDANTVVSAGGKSDIFEFENMRFHKLYGTVGDYYKIKAEEWQKLHLMLLNSIEPPNPMLPHSARPYLLGTVIYRDIFGEQHTTGFGLEMHITPPSYTISLIPGSQYNYQSQ